MKKTVLCNVFITFKTAYACRTLTVLCNSFFCKSVGRVVGCHSWGCVFEPQLWDTRHSSSTRGTNSLYGKEAISLDWLC